MRRVLALSLAVAAWVTPAVAEPPPEKGAVVMAGHTAGLVWERAAPKGVVALDVLAVLDGNLLLPDEPPEAFEERRTFVLAVQVRCRLDSRTCALGTWYLRQVRPGSFVYDAVRGEARLRAVLSRKDTLDVAFAVADPVPVPMRPGAGFTPSGEFVVTGGEGVSRAVQGSGNLFGIPGKAVGSVITGVLHNVYLTPPVGPPLDLSKLFR